MEKKTGDGGEGKIGPTYANERVTEESARKIGHELYHKTGYDAIWRLSNSGFVIRLDTTYIFLAPVLTSPLPCYETSRERARETGVGTYRLELKYYHEPGNIFREVHELPLPPEDVEQADYVLISHEHDDHLEIHGLQKIAPLEPTVVAPKSCHEQLL